MLDSLFEHPLWHLIIQADTVSKMILLLLLLMSIISWLIFFYKLILFYVKNKHLRSTVFVMQHVRTWEELTRALVYPETMPGHFLIHTMQYVTSLMDMHKQMGNLSISHWQQLQEVIYHKVDDMVYHEEELLWILSTSAGSATLLGLFGTVWGLVHAFLSISHKQAADIVVVAPGIAEALLTTLVGLIVAIPALIMFNYLHMWVRHIEQQLLSLAQKFNTIIQTKFI